MRIPAWPEAMNAVRGVALAAAVAVGSLLGACAMESSRLARDADVGAEPQIVAPVHTLLPTVQIAPARGWSQGGQPTAAAGAHVVAFARGLDHPRWLLVLPNGDVLVAETNAPPRPEEGKGLKGRAMQLVMKRAGAGVPSADRITLLRDVDGDGVAETRTPFLEGLHSPFGMVLVGSSLYVANTDAVLRFPYAEGATRITARGETLTELPAGPRNHHWTKNILASRDGAKLYATVGSNSNAAENGIAAEEGRAAIWEIDLATGSKREFATGLRNPNGLAWEPRSGALWTVANERDELGSDLVPDYLTSVKQGAFYGWPYSYYGAHVDERVKPQRPDLVARAVKPDYALGSHVAALGLAFAQPGMLPAPFGEGAFVGQHGSWNRSPLAGYNVVFVPFRDGMPSGTPIDVLSGFLDADQHALGRPVGVALDRKGGLLVADDVGNTIWRVTFGGR
jgi:glucose/arabinose dehydrogenase